MADGRTGARLLAVATLGAVTIALAAGCGGQGNGNAGSALEAPPIENQRGPAAYRKVIDQSFNLLVTYWGEQLGAEGAGTAPPTRLVSYWSRGEDVGCGGQPAGAANAQYCAPTDTISWDGNWLYGSLYRQAGDAAVAFVLAHEYGHLVQRRLGVANDFARTIEEELNADCLAGAWFGAVDEHVARLTDADYKTLYAVVLDVGDPTGLPWQDPTAHGTADQRGGALLFGGLHGPRACFSRYGPGFTL